MDYKLKERLVPFSASFEFHLVLASGFTACSEHSTQVRAFVDANQESLAVISVRLIYNS